MRYGVYGLRKHASGGSTNSHATGGTDAVSPSDIGAAVTPIWMRKDLSTTGKPGTVVVDLQTVAAAAGKVMVPLLIWGKLTGTTLTTITAFIRLTFSDATTKDFASGSSGVTARFTHYDHAADPARTDAWGTTETAVNIFIAAGAALDGKKVASVKLRGSTNNNTDDTTNQLRVLAYET